MIRAAMASLALLALATGCGQQGDPSDELVTVSEEGDPANLPAPPERQWVSSSPHDNFDAVPSGIASESPRVPSAMLDFAALRSRDDPDRLLRFYASAIRARDWPAAAQAWRASRGMTAERLENMYASLSEPLLVTGRGRVEGAAGSLFYEVPATLRDGERTVREGKIRLRRANDVPGASEEQLSWRIVESTPAR